MKNSNRYIVIPVFLYATFRKIKTDKLSWNLKSCAEPWLTLKLKRSLSFGVSLGGGRCWAPRSALSSDPPQLTDTDQPQLHAHTADNSSVIGVWVSSNKISQPVSKTYISEMKQQRLSVTHTIPRNFMPGEL